MHCGIIPQKLKEAFYVRKTFYLLMAVAFLVFAMVSLEGCGGSSNSFSYNNNNNNNNPDTGSVEEDLRDSLVNSDMASVMHGN